MASHGKRTGRIVKFVWSTILNDAEDQIARAQLRPGESVYAFAKNAISELAARRAADRKG